MLSTPPSPRISASVSAAAQSVATYGVQGIIPWYDANGNLTTGTQTNGKETFAKYLYT